MRLLGSENIETVFVACKPRLQVSRFFTMKIMFLASTVLVLFRTVTSGRILKHILYYHICTSVSRHEPWCSAPISARLLTFSLRGWGGIGYVSDVQFLRNRLKMWYALLRTKWFQGWIRRLSESILKSCTRHQGAQLYMGGAWLAGICSRYICHCCFAVATLWG